MADKDKKINEMDRALKEITKPKGWHRWANEVNTNATESGDKALEGISGLLALYTKLERIWRARVDDYSDGIQNSVPICYSHLQHNIGQIEFALSRMRELMESHNIIEWHPINMKGKVRSDSDWEQLRDAFPFTKGQILDTSQNEGMDELHDGEDIGIEILEDD